MSRPLTQSDIIFPTQSLNFSTTLQSLKRSALSITNRLTSIKSDSSFAISVAQAYNLPLVANERCGSWYIPPDKKGGSVYFKSTDGHMNEWSFNLRRLNLHLLDLVGGGAGGCVIVDSTRRGKSMPDALSKTVPIWCCVINRAILAESGPHELFTPPSAVSASEHAQIEKRIDGFVQDFLKTCNPNIPELRQKLQKPLRPIWVTQASTLPSSSPTFPDFHPIVLCTASRRVQGGEVSEAGYIQGAADDQEAWARGLTPQVFWKHHSRLLGTNEQKLPEVIAELVAQENGPDAVPICVKPTTHLHISSSQNLDIEPFDAIISCTPDPLTTTKAKHLTEKKYLHLPLVPGKLGSRDLRTQLSRLPAFMEEIASSRGSTPNILICDPTGKDLAVGVALAILCLYTDEKGNIRNTPIGNKIDKTFIKQRLTWITTSSPALNPSRATLQSVNAFLMPDRSTTERSAASPTQTAVASGLILVDETGKPTPTPQEPAHVPVTEPPYSPISTMEPSVPIHIPVTDLPYEMLPAIRRMSIQQSLSREESSLPTILFTNLQTSTPWTFTRTLTSKLPSHPSGEVRGTATFEAITASGASTPALVYAEEGTFTTTTGASFTARRKYIYRLLSTPSDPAGRRTSIASIQPTDKHIAVYFDNTETADATADLFVEMGPLQKDADGVSWSAENRAQHLCGEDLYTAQWRFSSGMLEEGHRADGDLWWEVRYDVKGPKKDYVSETGYSLKRG